MSTRSSLESFEKNLYGEITKIRMSCGYIFGGLSCLFTDAGYAVLAKHGYTSEPESRVPPWFWLQVPSLVALNDGLRPKSIK